jgi:hypothetical protein
MEFLQVGNSSFNVDAVKGKTLKELEELLSSMHPKKVEALYSELHKLGLTKKPKISKQKLEPKEDEELNDSQD